VNSVGEKYRGGRRRQVRGAAVGKLTDVLVVQLLYSVTVYTFFVMRIE
jgi:hypothetical protein